MLTVTLKKPARLNAHGRTWERGVAVPVDLTTARLLAKNPRFEVNGLFEALDALAEGKTLDDLGISETPDTEDDGVAEPPAATDLFDRIRAAADSLDVDNDDNFTADGKPTVAALEAILGEDITEEQRDAALTIPIGRGKLEAEQKPAAARPRAIKVKGSSRPKAKQATAPATPTTDEKAIEV